MDDDQGAINKLSHGELLGALHDATTWLKNRFTSLPSWVQAFLNKTGTQEYTILQSAVTAGVKDVVAGGLSTASFVAAGKDILAQLIAQNISTFSIQDVMANLNMAVAADPSAKATLASAQTALAAVDPNSPFLVPPAVAAAPVIPVTPATSGEALPSNVAGHDTTPVV